MEPELELEEYEVIARALGDIMVEKREGNAPLYLLSQVMPSKVEIIEFEDEPETDCRQREVHDYSRVYGELLPLFGAYLTTDLQNRIPKESAKGLEARVAIFPGEDQQLWLQISATSKRDPSLRMSRTVPLPTVPEPLEYYLYDIMTVPFTQQIAQAYLDNLERIIFPLESVGLLWRREGYVVILGKSDVPF
jgi:hypothetical protein